MQVFKLDFYTAKIRIENIVHDIAVIDTAIYLIRKHHINQTNILTERQIKHSNGFNNPKHDPDFIYTRDGKTIFVEVELTEKTFRRLENNIKTNFMKSDMQKYIVPSGKVKIIKNIERLQDSYPIEIIKLEEVQSYVKSI